MNATQGDQMMSFVALARQFLASNPQLLDTLVLSLHNVADELDSIGGHRMITNGKYVQPYQFKKSVVEKVMKKLGYSTSDIPDLCKQGRADELLQEIDRMEKPILLGGSSPSRRILPSRTLTNRTSTQIEDITKNDR